MSESPSPDLNNSRSNIAHNAMLLHFVDGTFLISSSTDAVQINRRDGSISAVSDYGTEEASALRIYGILGVITLLRGNYLIVITDREDVGKIQGERIWRITGTKILPYREYCSMTPKQEEDEEKYLSMLNAILSTPHFYFSYSYDLTNTQQRQKLRFPTPEEEKKVPLWKRADERFFWNRYLLEPFINSDIDLSKWIVPVMMGYVAIGTVPFDNSDPVDFVLISRRSVCRPGTRFWVRGIDKDGNVANFVETEQIICHKRETSSFVQIRGSIPVYWTQYVTMAWAPKPAIRSDSMDAFTKHFDNIIDLYGKPILIVNLANHHGSEGRLVNEYGRHVKQYAKSDALIYEAFDFHKECPGINWSRLSVLENNVAKHIDEIGCFTCKDGEVVRLQKGTVRTNCIDNLDRTNLVQGVFARRFLTKQLQTLGMLGPNDKLEKHPQLDSFLKHAWADNADIISLQYAGAGALKVDFTRFGKRTVFGYALDGINAVQRYVLNNFFDGSRHDAYNLFLGYVRVKPGTTSPFLHDADVKRRNRLYLFAVLCFALFSTMVMSPLNGSTGFAILSLLYWIGIVAGIYFGVKQFGSQLVSKPRLTPLELAVDKSTTEKVEEKPKAD